MALYPTILFRQGEKNTMKSIHHSVKIFLILGLFYVTAPCSAMQPIRTATNVELQLLQHAGYSAQSIADIQRNGLTQDDRSVLKRATNTWATVRASLNDYGYDYIFSETQGKFLPRWRPIKRSPGDIKYLKDSGFTDNDIKELTIENIDDPFNDARILRATRETQTNRRFIIFNSKLLWPHEPSEADILLLLPQLLVQDPDGINLFLIDGNGSATLLGIAARSNYQRVVAQLLNLYMTAPNRVMVNKHSLTGLSPLELAVEADNIEMVILLLTHPLMEITLRAYQLTERPAASLGQTLHLTRVRIRMLLEEGERNRANTAITHALPSAPPPSPAFLLAASTPGGLGTPIPMTKPAERLAPRPRVTFSPSEKPATSPATSAKWEISKKWVVGGMVAGISVAAATIQWIFSKKATPANVAPKTSPQPVKIKA
jgi:hypothetical protein